MMNADKQAADKQAGTSEIRWATDLAVSLQAKRLAQEDMAATAAQRQPQDCERYAEAARERWDVESVLSLRSNLDNHPASIAEPQSSRRPRQQVWPLRLRAECSGCGCLLAAVLSLCWGVMRLASRHLIGLVDRCWERHHQTV